MQMLQQDHALHIDRSGGYDLPMQCVHGMAACRLPTALHIYTSILSVLTLRWRLKINHKTKKIN